MRQEYNDDGDEEGIMLTRTGYRDDVDEDKEEEESGLTGGAAAASLSLSDADLYARTSKSPSPSRCGSTKRCLAVAVLGASVVALVAYFFQDRVGVAVPFSNWLGLHPGFVLESSDDLPEYGSKLLVYKHTKTDAKVAAMVPEQPVPGEDKAFGIGFRTRPTSNTGVAHILEHSVLCGSKKYMAKDPFVYLLKGSLHTFLNAYTYSDRTLYPVASRNSQDYLHLVDVYLDAVFNPRCVTDEGWWVLLQEGWRYVDDGNGLEIKGVVHSEMLGAYSDPDELLYQQSQSLLFPDNTYFFDSGGEPSEISSLTREEYVNFYHRHYHPTNSKTFIAGDDKDVQNVLHLLDTYLKKYEFNDASRENSRIHFQPKKFEEPLRASKPYPSADNDEDNEEGAGGHNMLISWLIDDEKQRLSSVEELAFLILDDMMLGSSSSVLEKALMDSGLGEEPIPDGVDRSMLQLTFQVGMKGVKDEKGVLQVEEVIMKTLSKLADDGFDGDDIKASINSIEFELREFSGGSDPRGINFYTRVMNKWNYDIHPMEALAFEGPLNQLKGVVDDSGSAIFQTLIQDYLLNNPHRVILHLYPDANMEAEQLEHEKKQLADIKNSFKSEELQDVMDQAKSLEEIQSADDPPEAVAAIPSLSLDDLDRDEVEFPIRVQENAFGSGVTLVSHIVPSSSGISYIDLGFDISNIDYADVPLLPFMERMFLETGTKDMTDVELDRLIGMHTGGIDVERVVETIVPDGARGKSVYTDTRLRTMLFVQGKCMADKVDQMFPLMLDVLASANLDSPKKAKQMLRETISNIESDIQSDGQRFASRRIRSRYSIPGFLDEVWKGTSHLVVLKDLLEDATSDWPSILKRLEQMREAIIGSSLDGVIVNFSGDQFVYEAVEGSIRTFLTSQILELHANIPDQGNGRLPDFKSVEVGQSPTEARSLHSKDLATL